MKSSHILSFVFVLVFTLFFGSSYAEDGRTEITSIESFSFSADSGPKEPLTKPSPPGASWGGNFAFSYTISGGFEEHFSELVIQAIMPIYEDEEFVRLQVDLKIFDATKSGKIDTGRARLFIDDNKFSSEDLRKLVLAYNGKLDSPIKNLEDKEIRFELRFPHLLFSINESNQD